MNPTACRTLLGTDAVTVQILVEVRSSGNCLHVAGKDHKLATWSVGLSARILDDFYLGYGTKDFDKYLRADVFAISFPFAHLTNRSLTPFPSCFNRSFSVSISLTHSHGGRRLVHQSFDVLTRHSSVPRSTNNSPLGVLPACRPPMPK